MDALDKQIFKLLFGVERSKRYHNERRKFYDGWHKFTATIGVIFGSATILTVLTETLGQVYTIAAAAIVTIFSIIDLVVGTAEKARLHYDLAKQFIALEKDIISEQAPTETDLANWTTQRLEIEADESPRKKVLNMMMHNELMRAKGYERNHPDYVKIAWSQRALAHFIDFRHERIHKVGASGVDNYLPQEKQTSEPLTVA